MSSPGVSGRVKAAAFGVVLLILGATLAVLVASLRLGADIRLRLRAVDEQLSQLSRLSQRTGADTAGLTAKVAGLSSQLDELSRSMRSDIGSAGRSTRADVSRLRDRLSERLEEVAQRVTTLADRPLPAPMVLTAPSGSPVQSEVTSLAPSSAAAALLSTTTTVEEDLFAARQAEQAAAWFETGKYEQAQKAFGRILADHPQDPVARLYFAASLYRTNPADSSRYAQVEKNLRSILEADPRCVLALDTLASVEMERGRWTDALGHLARLAALEPADPRCQAMAGFCAVKSSDHAAAREYYARAVELSPNDTRALTALGDCEWDLGHGTEACSAWEAALSLLDARTPASSRAAAELRAKIAKSAEGGAR
jgi:tetratricopeptide (TPR) repeat protein